MITEKQIIKQARKYFWQQKRGEVKDFFDDIVWFFEKKVVWFFEDWWQAFAIVMIFLGSLFQLGWYEKEAVTLAIVGLCMIGLWVLIGLIALVKVIVDWIKDNWDTALERARDESKSEPRGKKK